MDVASTLKEITPLFLLQLEEHADDAQIVFKLNTFLSTYDPIPIFIIYSSFASDHLPEYLDVVTRSFKGRVPVGTFLSILGAVCSTFAFSRWVRDNAAGSEGKAFSLLGDLIIWFDELFPAFCRQTPAPTSQDILQTQKAVCLILVAILVQLPPSFQKHTWTFLFASTEYAEASRRFRNHVKSSVSLWRSLPSREKDGLQGMAIIPLVFDFLDHEQTLAHLRTTSTDFGKVLPWIHYQARRELGNCVIEVDQEMVACGRCKAVRYCSKAHQKFDWKHHRRVCFEMKWGKNEL